MTLLVAVAVVLSVAFVVSIALDVRSSGWRSVPTQGDLVLALFVAFLLTLWMVLDAVQRK